MSQYINRGSGKPSAEKSRLMCASARHVSVLTKIKREVRNNDRSLWPVKTSTLPLATIQQTLPHLCVTDCAVYIFGGVWCALCEQLADGRSRLHALAVLWKNKGGMA